MSTVVRAAAAQVLSTFDVAQNAVKVRERMSEAAKNGCQVVLFPEGCITGYPDAVQLAHTDFDRVAKEEESIRQLAEELQLATIIGSTSRATSDEDSTAYNDLLIIDEGGRVIGRYAKTWGEPHYGAGSGPVLFQCAGCLATCIICADLRYPELVRLPAALGAQIVFIANNEGGLDLEDMQLGYRSMHIARATENHIYSVMANPPADPADFGRYNSSHGNSKVVVPLGDTLVEAVSFAECLVTADLDLEAAVGTPPKKTLGADGSTSAPYPAYAAWVDAGTKLVARIDGGGRNCRRAALGSNAPTGGRFE